MTDPGEQAASQADIFRLAQELDKTSGRIGRLEEGLRKEMRDGFRDIRGVIDSFLNKLETYARETVTIPRTLDAHGKTLRDHDERLRRIEAPPQ